MNKKLMMVILMLAVLALSLGCTIPQNDPNALSKMTELKQKYGVEDKFSPDTQVMSSYINDLSALRGKSSGTAAKVIDAELASSQAFYYLSKALAESTQIDYVNAKCNSIPVKSTASLTKLALEASGKATSAISVLTSEEMKLLRSNQLELMNEINIQAQKISELLSDMC